MQFRYRIQRLNENGYLIESFIDPILYYSGSRCNEGLERCDVVLYFLKYVT